MLYIPLQLSLFSTDRTGPAAMSTSPQLLSWMIKETSLVPHGWIFDSGIAVVAYQYASSCIILRRIFIVRANSCCRSWAYTTGTRRSYQRWIEDVIGVRVRGLHSVRTFPGKRSRTLWLWCVVACCLWVCSVPVSVIMTSVNNEAGVLMGRAVARA